MLKLSRMTLVSTFISSDKINTSKVSYADEFTYVVEFFTNSHLDSYAYYDTLEHAEEAAEKFVVE